MAKRKASEDVLQRQLILRKLGRDERRYAAPIVLDYIGQLRAWVKGAAKRAERPGGIGRR